MKYKQIGYPMPLRVKNQFKHWLVKNNISMSEFARSLGVSKQYISAIINKKDYLTPTIIQMFDSKGFHIELKKSR